MYSRQEDLTRMVFRRTNEHVLSLGSYRTDAHGLERGAQGISGRVGGSGPGNGHTDPSRVDVFPLILVLFFVFIFTVNSYRGPLSIHRVDVTTGFGEFVWVEREESVQLRIGLRWHKGLMGRSALGRIAIKISLVGFQD